MMLMILFGTQWIAFENLIETTQITGGKYLPPETTIRAALNQTKYDGIGRYMNDKRAKKRVVIKEHRSDFSSFKNLYLFV